MTKLMRFPTAIPRDPRVDGWMRGHPGELGEIDARLRRRCARAVARRAPDRLLTQLIDAAYTDMQARVKAEE